MSLVRRQLFPSDGDATGGTLGKGAHVQDQAILPFSIALGICVRGIRTRLGRSIVTLGGVCFGIAFLMSLITSVHLKDRLAGQASAKRDADRTVALTRGELGSLKGKRLVLVGAPPGAGQRDELARSLRNEQGAALVDLRGVAGLALDARLRKEHAPAPEPGVPAQATLPVICVGAPDPVLVTLTSGALAGKTFLALAPLGRGVMEQLHSQGVLVGGEADGDGRGRVKVLSLELREEERTREAARAERERSRTFWVLGASLLLTVIGITNAMLMSVTERFREIGTMKCLGALPNFVVRLFLIESSILGFIGSSLGCLIGAGFACIAYASTYGFSAVASNLHVGSLVVFSLVSVAVGVTLSIVAAIYPARVAASMIPASALATNI